MLRFDVGKTVKYWHEDAEYDMEFHFEARYPDEQKKFYKKCTKEFATKKMKEIKEVFTLNTFILPAISSRHRHLRPG